MATPTGRAIFAIFAKSGKDAPEHAALVRTEGTRRGADIAEKGVAGPAAKHFDNVVGNASGRQSGGAADAEGVGIETGLTRKHVTQEGDEVGPGEEGAVSEGEKRAGSRRPQGQEVAEGRHRAKGGREGEQ